VGNSWFARNFGDATLAGQALQQVKDLFRLEHVKAGRPGDMAVFIRHESEGRLHCEVVAYFSPAAAVVARAVDADACAKPARDGLELLAGVEPSWLALFSDASKN